MNKYAKLAQRHWQTYLPDRFQAIPQGQRTKFFEQLGDQAAMEIEALQTQLAGPDPKDEPMMHKLGRLNAARQMAEERVLADLILLQPTHDPEDLADDSPSPEDLAFQNRWRQINQESDS